jgi:hypothetical protein
MSDDLRHEPRSGAGPSGAHGASGAPPPSGASGVPDPCARTREQLAAAIDAPLPLRVREEVDRHLAGCADCRAVATWMERIDAVAAAAPAPPVPPPRYFEELRRSVMDEVLFDPAAGAQGAPTGARPWWKTWLAVLRNPRVVATLCAVALLGIFTYAEIRDRAVLSPKPHGPVALENELTREADPARQAGRAVAPATAQDAASTPAPAAAVGGQEQTAQRVPSPPSIAPAAGTAAPGESAQSAAPAGAAPDDESGASPQIQQAPAQTAVRRLGTRPAEAAQGPSAAPPSPQRARQPASAAAGRIAEHKLQAQATGDLPAVAEPLARPRNGAVSDRADLAAKKLEQGAPSTDVATADAVTAGEAGADAARGNAAAANGAEGAAVENGSASSTGTFAVMKDAQAVAQLAPGDALATLPTEQRVRRWLAVAASERQPAARERALGELLDLLPVPTPTAAPALSAAPLSKARAAGPAARLSAPAPGNEGLPRRAAPSAAPAAPPASAAPMSPPAPAKLSTALLDSVEILLREQEPRLPQGDLRSRVNRWLQERAMRGEHGAERD